jgi:hypothetical protein
MLRLKKVKTLTAGKLLEAARLKERQDILVHLGGTGRDLPALEPLYHHSCYMDLTRFLSKPEKNLEEVSRHYMKAYEKFCETVVVPQILKGKHILLLKSLTESFVKMVKEVEDIDTQYRSTNLKKRLSNTYPQLQFTYDTRMGYIVYSGAISSADLVKDHVGQMSTDHSSEDDESDEPDEQSQLHMHPCNQDDMRTTYFSSKIVKNAIQESVSNFECPWPPIAENLNTDSARKLVPHELFNWIAWTTGISEEPAVGEYVKVAENEEKKILSIAQDIIFLKAKGRVITPKH